MARGGSRRGRPGFRTPGEATGLSLATWQSPSPALTQSLALCRMPLVASQTLRMASFSSSGHEGAEVPGRTWRGYATAGDSQGRKGQDDWNRWPFDLALASPLALTIFSSIRVYHHTGMHAALSDGSQQHRGREQQQNKEHVQRRVAAASSKTRGWDSAGLLCDRQQRPARWMDDN